MSEPAGDGSRTTPPLPDDLPVVERDAVRVVVQDAGGDVLLLHAQDSSQPAYGRWWELPGGGIEPGESVAETAVRELREETGIAVPVSAVGPATWRRNATFRYRGRRHLQHEVVVLVAVDAYRPALTVDGRVHFEAEDYPEHRWWPVAELTGSDDRFYPSRLPLLLPGFLRGDPIDEPFELFN